MRFTRKGVLVAGCVGAVLVALILLQSRSRMLLYSGEPIDYWFSKLPVTYVNTNDSVFRASSILVWGQIYGGTNANAGNSSLAAFDHFGTKGIPFLMRKLEGKDSIVEAKARKLTWKSGRGAHFPARIASVERSQAVTALMHLRELPEETLLKLDVLTASADPEVASAARYVINARFREAGAGQFISLSGTNLTR